MTGRSTGRICVAALVFAACSLGAASAAEQQFRHGQMVVLDQKGLVNQLLPLGISLTGNSGSEIVVLEGLVEGTQLSVGVNLSSNRWSLHAEDVGKAFVGAPHDFSGTMEVTAKLYSASNEPLQSKVVRLEWARGEGAIPSGNPVRSRAGVDPASGVKAANAAPRAPASQDSPPLKTASAPIVAANPSPAARAAQADSPAVADSPASAVSVPETKSSQPKSPPVLDQARPAEDLDAPLRVSERSLRKDDIAAAGIVPRRAAEAGSAEAAWRHGPLGESVTVMGAPAVAGGAGEHRCCGWFPKGFPHWIPGLHQPEPAYPAYYAGPLSGATYEFYYEDTFGRPYMRRSARSNRGHYE
jgi:hypothetical protein